VKYLKSFNESEIWNGASKHYNALHPVNNRLFSKPKEFSYRCNDCYFDFVTYDPNQSYCNVCESENIERIVSESISIFSQDWKKYLPEEISIITDNGEFTLSKKDLMINGDLLQFSYYHNTTESEDGDVLADGEPDYLAFDIHVMKKNDGTYANPDTLRLDVDITYGDAMVSEFSIEKPNKVDVIHYTGKGSMHDSDSFFGFTDKSLLDITNFFNTFGYNLTTKDFLFIDKTNDEYNEQTGI
jgi:predicted Zn-ribbon and HTH transcriptional regulator